MSVERDTFRQLDNRIIKDCLTCKHRKYFKKKYVRFETLIGCGIDKECIGWERDENRKVMK